jgi:molybdenum cofactor cytidylyltransferase
MKKITGILLAAGQSRRFGGNKLLHPLVDGIPVVVHAARTLRSVLQQTVVVVNATDTETIDLLQNERVQIMVNQDAKAGMGTSIACGVRASQGADGWVIALADMPYVRSQTLRSVAAGIHNAHTICAPVYSGRRGHPVGFGQAYREELMRLRKDEGARRIITANPAYLDLFETHDKGVIADIDCPADVLAVVARTCVVGT